jgi:hypothetical protein
LITLVACDPKYQNRGFGSLAVKDSLAYAAKAGAKLALLYGHPGYYPRFGFVPVLPAAVATLAVDDVSTVDTDERRDTDKRCDAGEWRGAGALHGHVPSRLLVREIQDSDIPALLEMYESQLAGYPCSVRRDVSPWIWKPRGAMPGRDVLVFLDTQSGQLVGYCFCTDNPDRSYLTVMEAAASDKTVASCMVSTLARRAAVLGRKYLKVSTAPDSVVFQAALDKGAGMEYKAAAAGLACVLSWGGLLPGGYRVEHIAERTGEADGPSPDDAFNLYRGNDLVLTADRAFVTRLVVGYDDAGSLKGLKDFPKSFPKWHLAPYWY